MNNCNSAVVASSKQNTMIHDNRQEPNKNNIGEMKPFHDNLDYNIEFMFHNFISSEQTLILLHSLIKTFAKNF